MIILADIYLLETKLIELEELLEKISEKDEISVLQAQ